VKKAAFAEPPIQSTTKEPTPQSRLICQTPSAAPEQTKLNCLQHEPAHCYHLLALASTLSLSTKDPVAAASLLANFFQNIAQGTNQSDEVISAAIRILDPIAPVPPQVLSAVVKQAFGAATAVGGDEDALAEASLLGSRAASNPQGSQRLLLTDVARAANERDSAQLVSLVMVSRV